MQYYSFHCIFDQINAVPVNKTVIILNMWRVVYLVSQAVFSGIFFFVVSWWLFRVSINGGLSSVFILSFLPNTLLVLPPLLVSLFVGAFSIMTFPFPPFFILPSDSFFFFLSSLSLSVPVSLSVSITVSVIFMPTILWPEYKSVLTSWYEIRPEYILSKAGNVKCNYLLPPLLLSVFTILTLLCVSSYRRSIFLLFLSVLFLGLVFWLLSITIICFLCFFQELKDKTRMKVVHLDGLNKLKLLLDKDAFNWSNKCHFFCNRIGR